MKLKSPKSPLLKPSTAKALIQLIIKAGKRWNNTEDDEDQPHDFYQLQIFAEATWRALYYKLIDYEIDEDPEVFIPYFRDLPNHPRFMVDLAVFLGLTPDQLESMVNYLEREAEENDDPDHG